MTIRRWLRHDDAKGLPQKYWPIFDQTLFGSADLNASFQHGFDELESHVHGLGQGNPDAQHLQNEVENKMAGLSIAKPFQERVQSLFSALKTREITEYSRSLIYGALIYFINPMDLVPDTVPMIGLLDDYSVISMVLSSLKSSLSKK